MSHYADCREIEGKLLDSVRKKELAVEFPPKNVMHKLQDWRGSTISEVLGRLVVEEGFSASSPISVTIRQDTIEFYQP